jgi:hypothetical protein
MRGERTRARGADAGGGAGDENGSGDFRHGERSGNERFDETSYGRPAAASIRLANRAATS